MANVLINEDTMTNIANAIRSKKGVSTKYKPNEMPDAISSISGGGGITPTGTINITTNGTHDVTQYASANVNVPTGGSTPTGTKQISITSNGTTTEDVTNYANAEITVNVQSGGGGSSKPTLLASGTYAKSDGNVATMAIPVTFTGTMTAFFVIAPTLIEGVGQTYSWTSYVADFDEMENAGVTNAITAQYRGANGSLGTGMAAASYNASAGTLTCGRINSVQPVQDNTYNWYIYGYAE